MDSANGVERRPDVGIVRDGEIVKKRRHTFSWLKRHPGMYGASHAQMMHEARERENAPVTTKTTEAMSD